MIEKHPGIFTNQQWSEGSGAIFSSINPANRDRVWTGQAASPAEVSQAVQNARKAFPSWADLSIDERSQYLNHFSDILQLRSYQLAIAISQETGKPLWESQQEVASMISKVGISLEAYGRRCAGMIRDQPNARSITRHRPHGVIAVFGPFNFPGHLPNGHIIPALLAGNTVVFKPSELTPLVAEEMIKSWELCHLPAGVINLVQGGHETGGALATHPDIDGLLFTGSYKTGKWLSETFASHPEKILALEMGGNNPLIVSQIHDVKTAAYLTIQSAYLSTGQRCTCARRLIVPEGKIGDQFIQELVNMTQSLVIGSYSDKPEPFMGPVIHENQVNHLLKVQEDFMSRGGIPLLEMRALKAGTGFISPGLMDVTAIQDRPDEEFFGPFLQLIRVENFEEAIEEANKTKFGLAAGLLSENQEEYQTFYRRIKAGIINWNTQLTGASSAAPFGGVGCSGNARPSAYYAADYCSYPVASMEAKELKMPMRLTPGLEI